jgi:hypothetical protein
LRRSSLHADMSARDEDANFRVRLHLATRPSCFHVGVVAAFHVRARCTIRLSTSVHSRHVAVLHVPAFTVSTIFRSRPRSVPAVARSLSAVALMIASRRP